MVVRTPTPNYLRQASPDRGKYRPAHSLLTHCVASHPAHLVMFPFSLTSTGTAVTTHKHHVDVERRRGCRPLPASVKNTTLVQAAPGVCAASAHVNGTSAESELSLYANVNNHDVAATRHRQAPARRASCKSSGLRSLSAVGKGSICAYSSQGDQRPPHTTQRCYHDPASAPSLAARKARGSWGCRVHRLSISKPSL